MKLDVGSWALLRNHAGTAKLNSHPSGETQRCKRRMKLKPHADHSLVDGSALNGGLSSQCWKAMHRENPELLMVNRIVIKINCLTVLT
jgi:hypothetical protein